MVSSGAGITLGLALNFSYAAGSVIRKHASILNVEAASPGAWGNRIKLELTPLDPGYSSTHFSLRVTVDQGEDPAQPPQQEYYPLLSLDPNDPSRVPIYAPVLINTTSQLIRFTVAQDPIPQWTQLLVGVGPLASGELYLEAGSDGATGTSPKRSGLSGRPGRLGLGG